MTKEQFLEKIRCHHCHGKLDIQDNYFIFIKSCLCSKACRSENTFIFFFSNFSIIISFQENKPRFKINNKMSVNMMVIDDIPDFIFLPLNSLVDKIEDLITFS